MTPAFLSSLAQAIGLEKPRSGGSPGMSDIENLERVIRTAWAERGKAQWNPETHGRGRPSIAGLICNFAVVKIGGHPYGGRLSCKSYNYRFAG